MKLNRPVVVKLLANCFVDTADLSAVLWTPSAFFCSAVSFAVIQQFPGDSTVVCTLMTRREISLSCTCNSFGVQAGVVYQQWLHTRHGWSHLAAIQVFKPLDDVLPSCGAACLTSSLHQA